MTHSGNEWGVRGWDRLPCWHVGGTLSLTIKGSGKRSSSRDVQLEEDENELEAENVLEETCGFNVLSPHTKGPERGGPWTSATLTCIPRWGPLESGF